VLTALARDITGHPNADLQVGLAGVDRRDTINVSVLTCTSSTPAARQSGARLLAATMQDR
jgi:hypothetical protein